MRRPLSSSSFFANAELVIAVAPERVFDRLGDVASWASWMPRSFRPAQPRRRAAPTSPLRVGDRFYVRIGGLPVPSKLTVSAAERPRELAWTGGVPGVLFAEHRFLFEPEGDGKTRVRSVERWSGALAGVLRRAVEPLAVKIGREQIEALARSLEVS